jgi:hypothetical protein
MITINKIILYDYPIQRGGDGVAASPSWSKKLSDCCTLLDVFIVQIFSKVNGLPTDKVVRYQKQNESDQLTFNK